jgi:hypothetical protein
MEILCEANTEEVSHYYHNIYYTQQEEVNIAPGAYATCLLSFDERFTFIAVHLSVASLHYMHSTAYADSYESKSREYMSERNCFAIMRVVCCFVLFFLVCTKLHVLTVRSFVQHETLTQTLNTNQGLRYITLVNIEIYDMLGMMLLYAHD